MTGSGGGTSTPRLIDFITAASGRLDHPLSRVMTTEYAFAFSRRKLRPRVSSTSSLERKRKQGMPGARCTRGLVCKVRIENAHEHTGTVGTLRHSLRSGFTAYAELSPETNSFCLRRWRINGSSKTRSGFENLRQLDQPRVPGPHGFAVRFSAVRLRAVNRSRLGPPCDHLARRRCRVHRIPSRVRDDARSAPLVGTRRRKSSRRPG